LIVIGALLIILVGVSVYSFALLFPHVGQTSLSTLTATPSGTVSVKTDKARRVVGTIQSLGNQTLVVMSTQGSISPITVNVDTQTTFTSLTGPATFNDLKVGQTVEVRGHPDPQDPIVLLATNIVINPPA
jgi:hypothetical protein